MTKRLAFLISTEGKTAEEMKREAGAALERFAQAVEAVEGTAPPAGDSAESR